MVQVCYFFVIFLIYIEQAKKGGVILKRKTFSPNKILFALILGIVFGLIANALFPVELNNILTKWILSPIGNVFLRGIQLIVVPLVLCSIICGVANIEDLKGFRRIGSKIITYYILTTALAITLALIFANIIKPGIGLNITLPTEYKVAKIPFIMDLLINIIPVNPIESLVKGEMLQIIVFAIVCGVAIRLIGKPVKQLQSIISQVNDIMIKILDIVLLTAPLGIFALISRLIIVQSLDVLIPMLKYVITILIVLLFQLLIVYGLTLKMFGRVNPISFFKKYFPVMIVAFSTSSSNATIPVSIDTCQKKLGVSKSIASFAIPLGAAVNIDGTAIMQGVAAIFIAQVFGIELTFLEQLMIIFLAVLASIGTAGMPGAGIIALAMILQQVGIPIEGIAVIVSVAWILDMFQTVVNVTGDAVGAVVVARSEKELDLDVYNA